jgi:3-hydroxymyristoyl/3-hydroxydecanoyl-(acyl carrier protein) dehydratase
VTPAGSFAVPAAHPMFVGHFPGNPIVPGAYLLALVQRHADDWLRAQGRAERVAGVASAKFLRPLRPDEECSVAFAAPEQARLRFRLEVAGAPCASGVLVLGTDERGLGSG